MIYHYFGSKQDLYLAVLERVYQRVRSREEELNLRDHDPVEGMLLLVDFTFQHLAENPEFIALCRRMGYYWDEEGRTPERLIENLRESMRTKRR